MAGSSPESISGISSGLRKKVVSGFADTINYFRVSPQLTIPDLIYPPIITYLDYQLILGHKVAGIFNEAFMVPASGIALMWLVANRFKAFDNLMKYKDVRQFLDINMWDSKALDQYQHHFCTRNAAAMAARDEGYSWQLEQYEFEKESKKLTSTRPFRNSIMNFERFYQTIKNRVPS